MKISKITPRCPELVSKGYEKKIEKQFNNFQKTEDALYTARALVFELEDVLKKEQEKWAQIQAMFDIEFENEDLENDEPKGDPDVGMTLGIINHSDYRNKNV